MKTLIDQRRRYTLGAILTVCGAVITGVGHIAGQQPAAHPGVAGETTVNSETASASVQDQARLSPDDGEHFAVAHAECSFFGEMRDASAAQIMKSASVQPGRRESTLSALTNQVTRRLNGLQSADRARSFTNTQNLGLIDSYLYADMQTAGVQPADKTTDFEFIRRVTLDLTGRIPDPQRVLSFVVQTAPDKRARLVDELLGNSAWVDKWTMYFGDLFKNTVRNTQINRYPEGRNAFYKWIHDSLASGKPYDQMARELISTQGGNSFDPNQGAAINWLVGGVVTGGPVQDIMDQQAANVAETFLGISHMNCLLCHNGRGHLDQLSLWGSRTTRYQAWQFASFLSHTATRRVRTTDANGPKYYWSVEDNVPRFRNDYPLNTTTGNRPPRQPNGTVTKVAPVYFFNGKAPAQGQDYRAALGLYVTTDMQFARAAVNYIWTQFFGRGIVDPPNQFDLARLDPNNPPPAPWTIQPSDPQLLNALAQHFIDSGFDLKSLMRDITNSEAYQLSSRYNGEWNPAWESLFARKMVRRLWAEEIHDAIVQSSGIAPSYNIRGFSQTSTVDGTDYPGFGRIKWALQFPDVVGVPDGNGAVSQFLDNFLRGNRDDEQRRSEGSILQALDLMNDKFVASRVHATGSGTASGLLARNISQPNDELIHALYLAVLSRYPTDQERNTALANFGQAANRQQAAEDLLWSLYNEVDFVFNY